MIEEIGRAPKLGAGATDMKKPISIGEDAFFLPHFSVFKK